MKPLWYCFWLCLLVWRTSSKGLATIRAVDICSCFSLLLLSLTGFCQAACKFLPEITMFHVYDAFSFSNAVISVANVPATPNRTFLHLSYVMLFIHWPTNTTFFFSKSRTMPIWTASALPSFAFFTFFIITHSFDNGPIMSVTFLKSVISTNAYILFVLIILRKSHPVSLLGPACHVSKFWKDCLPKILVWNKFSYIFICVISHVRRKWPPLFFFFFWHNFKRFGGCAPIILTTRWVIERSFYMSVGGSCYRTFPTKTSLKPDHQLELT